MPSPADREVEVREDVDRIARHFHAAYEELAPAYVLNARAGGAIPWDQVPDEDRELMRAVVRRLLTFETIKVGRRPVTIDQMLGQTSIDDEDTSAD